MPVPEKKKMMVVQIYDEDSKREELISECDLDISKVLEEGEHDGWFPLQYKGRPAGEIYLEMTFYSAAPPPKRQPTRYGMRPKQHGGYAPPVPNVGHPAQHYPYHPTQPSNARPLPPAPAESHSTPTSHLGQYPPTHPSVPPSIQPSPYTGAYPPPAPTSSMSSGSQPPSGRPASYTGPQSVNHINRPTSPPAATPNPNSHLAPGAGHAPLLSSPYNPSATISSGASSHSNYGKYMNNGVSSNNNSTIGYPPSNHGGYPPYSNNNNNNNRNSYPPQTNSPYPPYPPSSNQFHRFPEPQQFPHGGGYPPQQADPLGTPFAAHQGSFYSPNPGNYPPRPYPPQHQNMGGYPPQHSNNGYPPY
ncbi:hypothetical protein BCV72DRAFT_196430 [Rhizopus microsporus var. microsporus]|uniref:Uncharacterized protein n=1 Tax=Rhizopus microsporus var. microsporus TaxID=86635 RepID=A0A1X0RIX1_RHIZD|nr:hypothetical protein BCV72DRAFT_196430 [Rhizopus microsporus var. microsporus]